MSRRSATAWEVLSPEQHAAVLTRLMASHPEIRAEADETAIAVLAEVDRTEVANEVCWALESVLTADVGARSGRQRGRGYVDPSEAAWELLGAAVEPFLVRLRQLAEIGLHAAAIELGAGILFGLVEAKGDDECAIFFEEDFVAEQRADVLAVMREAGLDAASADSESAHQE